MQLPFTIEQFYGVFREYNTTVWPAQILLVALAIVAVALVAVPRHWSGAGISAIHLGLGVAGLVGIVLLARSRVPAAIPDK